MKAKRLRALLVAGLLSLAPAVTLTSCSGGGGGDGGDAGSSFDDGGTEAGGDETVFSIVGKTLIVEMGNGRQQITFGANDVATGLFTRSDGSSDLSQGGGYEIKPQSRDVAIVTIAFVNPVEAWSVRYSVADGKLKALNAVYALPDGRTRSYTNCRFQ